MAHSVPKARTIQSLDRALGLIETLSRAVDGMSLTALAQALDLSPQTAQSLLRTLQAHGWVWQSGRGRPYFLGAAPLRVASRWLDGNGIGVQVRERVVSLARRTGEYALLAELRGTHLTPLVEQRAERELMLAGEDYGADRIHAMATGQVLLASLPADVRRQVLATLPMPVRGPKSITCPEALDKRLRQVAQAGQCVCRQEAGEHIAALAVPVRDASGRVRAALGLSLPELRLNRVRERELLAELHTTAQTIEVAWGGQNS